MSGDPLQPLRTLEGHSAAIRALAITPEGTRIISGSEDLTLRIWSLPSGEALRTLSGHKQAVRAIAITPDGRRVVSGDEDGKLMVWDIGTGRLARRQSGCRKPVRAIVVAPDGQRIIAGGGNPHSVRSSRIYERLNPTLRAWHLDTGKRLPFARERGLSMATALAITADGARLFADVSSSFIDEVLGSAVLMNDNSFVLLWNLAATRPEPPRPVANHRGIGRALAVSPDGRILITADAGSALAVWDTEYRRELRHLQGHADSVRGIALLADGDRLLSASHDGRLLLWDLKAPVDSTPILLGRHEGPIYALAITPDESIAVTGGADGAMRLWELPRVSRLANLR